MKASDYIVEYLVDLEVKDVFGYPGGMVTHLMDSFSKYHDRITAHVMYHEQAVAFAACGYAQTNGKLGVAYATSGPGATNLITGICNAYFDSIPTLFITGQVNTYESKGQYGVRQRGFQETDIVSMVAPVTKYAAYVDSADKLEEYLNRAVEEATSGRMGPVLLDIPMNILRAEVNCDKDVKKTEKATFFEKEDQIVEKMRKALAEAKRPCCLIGNGVKISGKQEVIVSFCRHFHIPMVTSMIAFDTASIEENYFGFIGAYGNRAANFVIAKSDLVISIGARLDVRQVGAKREMFAPDAKLVRFDVDAQELGYSVHQDEVKICTDMNEVAKALQRLVEETDMSFEEWILICKEIKCLLANTDDCNVKQIVEKVSNSFPQDCVVTTDVGQNQVWVAQFANVKRGQKYLFSGGHGAMGYALPAAIGAYYASGTMVICISGDGGLQMNIQELQYIARERIPVKIIVLNNDALGMIRHFQEMYFQENYFQTTPEGGYKAPDFRRIAHAYGIRSARWNVNEIPGQIAELKDDDSILIEICIHEKTYVFPKLEFGKPNQDQEPLLRRELYQQLMDM